MNYEQLKSELRNWTNARGDSAPYDFVGMLNLFRACLQNMMAHSTDADWDGAVECAVLTDEKLRFIRQMLNRFD